MATPSMQDVLAQLASQQAQIADLQAARRRARRRFPRRLLPLALVALFVALMPLSAFAAISFNDLNAGSVHNPNIQAIADAGITTGCVPNVSYCPNDNVTREEMASFLARTAGLGDNPPVADAATLQGYAPDELVRISSAFGTSFALGDPAHPSQTATVTIEAPGPGFVLVTTTAEATTTAASGCPCLVSLDILAGSGAVAPNHTALLANSTGGQPGVASLANTYMFRVDAAGTQRYIARMAFTGSPVTIVGRASMTILFVPFDADGALSEP
jgi:hypothetical protein